MSLLRRKPRGPVKRDPQNPAPDERIFGRHYRGPSPVAIGLIVALLFVVGFYLGFTKRIPFTSRGYELHATFENATTLKPNSPGADRRGQRGQGQLGRARGQHGGGHVQRLRRRRCRSTRTPRSRSGRGCSWRGTSSSTCTRGARALRSSTAGRRFPITQTTTAVQIDEILTSLQSDTRTNLKRALEGYGTALNAAPTAAEDATQDPDVQGLTGAQAINETFRYGGKAGRTSAIVNQAFLGQHPHDLSNLIRAQRDLFAKLASTDGALSDLITNFNITAGAFAVGVRQPLGLDPASSPPPSRRREPSLRHLNDALPPFRRLARESLPGHPRAPGDDPRRLAVAGADGQAAEAERARRHRPAARRVGAAASPRPATRR